MSAPDGYRAWIRAGRPASRIRATKQVAGVFVTIPHAVAPRGARERAAHAGDPALAWAAG